MAHPDTALRFPSFTIEPARIRQIEGHPFAHEIRVALPLSYAESGDRTYPVLWVTDNVLETALTMLGSRELIVVSVGGLGTAPDYPGGGRAYDFYPQLDISATGAIADAMRERGGPSYSLNLGGGAAAFRDFLIDDLRPELEAEYRMDPHDHGLEGFSAGGWFVVYTMFTRPGAFAKLLAGAPALYYCQDLIWRIEEEYAATHDDLAGKVFFGTGDREMAVDWVHGCFSSMAKMIERLSFRAYPSLEVGYSIPLGEDHATGRPTVLGNGVRYLWG